MQHKTTTPVQALTSPVTLQALEDELASFYAGLAVLLEECFKPDAGKKMLGIADDEQFENLIEKVNIRSTRIGKMLPVWFRYGYQGVLSAGFDLHQFEAAEGPYERLTDMLGLLRTDDAYFEWCLMGADVDLETVRRGSLVDLTRRVDARRHLDGGKKLNLSELALLADMNERSVRNAVGAEGESRLVVGADGQVTNEEAVRWLRGRRGFIASEQRKLPQDLKTIPDALDAVEIPGFMRARLKVLWSSTDCGPGSDNHETWVVRAAREASLSPVRIEASTRLPFDIEPREASGLAKALKVEPVWFNYQVMCALFPEQVDMLLNPVGWSEEGTPAAIDTIGGIETAAAPQEVTIEVTRAMLAHGYIDLPASAKALFPADTFGGRGAGDRGEEVELMYGTHRVKTDIRTKSDKTISPRRRFDYWLKTELGAKAGDRIRIEKTAERAYTLTHLTN